MKKLFFFLLLLPVIMFAQPNPKGFTILGKLDGYADGTKVSLYQNGQQTVWLSTTLKKGKFTFKEKVDEPVLCFIIIDKVQKPIELYVENAVISVKGNKAKPDNYKIEGSASQKDFSDFITGFLPLAQQISTLANTINNTMPGTEREEMMKVYTGIQDKMQTEIDSFINNRPRSMVTPFILEVTYQFNEDVVKLENRFNQMDLSVRNTSSGKKLEALIAEKKIGAIGTTALDFTQADTTGTPVSLSSFRGKYVLVDFWASWCQPCRLENPNVVENYNKFYNKNFTVLGVSLDRPGQKIKWIDAIKEDNLNWTHVSDLQFWNNSVAKMYRISSIPQNFLIDPQGKIIGKNLRGPELEAKLCEVLGCN
ncbi:MAG: TlpA disulfide reductase family protein [Chitinophagaceae bacterium]